MHGTMAHFLTRASIIHRRIDGAVVRNIMSMVHGNSTGGCKPSCGAAMPRCRHDVHTSSLYERYRQLGVVLGPLRERGVGSDDPCRMLRYDGTFPRFMSTSIDSGGKKKVFRAEATYVGSMIRMYDLLNLDTYRNNFKAIHKGSALIGLHSPETKESSSIGTDGELPFGPYMGVTTYGSVVFFDTPFEVKNECLALMQQVVVDPVVERKYTEEFTISVDPQLPTWSKLDPECMVFQRMDLRNMHVISSVLSQSVALDYYSSHVERTLETFCSLNQEMMETANISKLNKQVLLQLVAENNIVMTEIISKLGVHERYDIAWKDAKYGHVWDFARTELEIETRFETLDMKLNLIQDNLKYFLEILQNRKSDFLEWIIIVLIAMEIGLSLYQLVPHNLT